MVATVAPEEDLIDVRVGAVIKTMGLFAPTGIHCHL